MHIIYSYYIQNSHIFFYGYHGLPLEIPETVPSFMQLAYAHELRRPKTKNIGYSSDFQSKAFKNQTEDLVFLEIIFCKSHHFKHLVLKSTFTRQEIEKIFDDVKMFLIS